MSLYPPPRDIDTQVWTRLPDIHRISGRESAWGAINKPGQELHSFLEGPSFDRDGHLYVTDIPYGRVFRIAPDGTWTLVAEYDGWPNGLKIHRDGRIFIADHKHGLMTLDPASGAVSPVLTDSGSGSFKGVNDLFFDAGGRLYFTDQGQTGMHDPSGRVFRYDLESGALDCLIDTAPSPNGLVTTPDETALYVAMTRGNAVWRLPLLSDGRTAKVGIFVQMAGGVSGADGMAVDVEGRLTVCDAGNGCAWTFSRWGEPVYRIRSAGGGRTVTNIAYGGPENRHVYLTESDTGNILRAELDAPGRLMFSHS